MKITKFMSHFPPENDKFIHPFNTNEVFFSNLYYTTTKTFHSKFSIAIMALYNFCRVEDYILLTFYQQLFCTCTKLPSFAQLNYNV